MYKNTLAVVHLKKRLAMLSSRSYSLVLKSSNNSKVSN